MGGETVAGIEASLFLDGFQLGQLIGMGGDEGLHVRRDVLQQRNGLILRLMAIAQQNRLQLIHLHMQTIRDQGQVSVKIAGLFWN